MEQLAVLWPVLGLWHPTLLHAGDGVGVLDVVRLSGVELLVKNTINHVRMENDTHTLVV